MFTCLSTIRHHCCWRYVTQWRHKWRRFSRGSAFTCSVLMPAFTSHAGIWKQFFILLLTLRTDIEAFVPSVFPSERIKERRRSLSCKHSYLWDQSHHELSEGEPCLAHLSINHLDMPLHAYSLGYYSYSAWSPRLMERVYESMYSACWVSWLITALPAPLWRHYSAFLRWEMEQQEASA